MTVSVLASGAMGSDGTGTLSGTHNPGASVTPHAVVAFVVQNGSSATGQINAPTYGGTAMVSFLSAADTTGEPGRVDLYYLAGLNSIQSGSQTASCTVNNTNSTRRLYVVSLATDADGLLTYTSGSDSNDQANPSNTFTIPSDMWAVAVACLYSGLPAASVSVATGAELAEANFSGNSQCASLAWSNSTVNNGSLTVGWTSASDDVAAMYLAFRECVRLSGTVTHEGSPVEGAEVIVLVQTAASAPKWDDLIDANGAGQILTDSSGHWSALVQKGVAVKAIATYESGGNKYTAAAHWGLDTTP